MNANMTNEQAYELGCKDIVKCIKAAIISLANNSIDNMQSKTLLFFAESLDDFPHPEFVISDRLDCIVQDIKDFKVV